MSMGGSGRFLEGPEGSGMIWEGPAGLEGPGGSGWALKDLNTLEWSVMV